jgi:methionyl-tRNA formyltransferase
VLRAVFMGTPAFALPSLEVTARRTELALVVTQPDRPAGRGRKLHPPPVKERALALGVEVAQPEASVTKELGERLEQLAPDLVIVAAFGKFLGKKVLRTPRLGCINVHASLLPRHRGANPPAWAILAGDAETGVTIQRMVPAMDEGDLLAQRATPIDPDETSGALTERLSTLGGELLTELIPALEAGTPVATPQDHARATLAPPLAKADGAIDWRKPARAVHDHVRAMNPWPMAFTGGRGGTRLRVLTTRVAFEEGVRGGPGEVILADKHVIRVACGQGAVELLVAQCEGKPPASATQLVCGRLLIQGEILCPAD